MRAHSVRLMESLCALAVSFIQREVGAASHARGSRTMPDSGDSLLSENNPSKHEQIRCQVHSGVVANGAMSALWKIGLQKRTKCQ